MLTVTLQRKTSSVQGTFGEISFEGRKLLTGELPYRSNSPGISCIPNGTYVCSLIYSPKFQRHTYLLQDVPGRTDIRIHSANYFADKTSGLLSEVEGCIGLGEIKARCGKQDMLLKSRQAVETFEMVMRGKEFYLTITDDKLVNS